MRFRHVLAVPVAGLVAGLVAGVVACGLSGCVLLAEPVAEPIAEPTRTSSPQPVIPTTIEAPELLPDTDAELLTQLTSDDDILSVGSFDAKGGGVRTMLDCAGAGTVTVAIGESSMTVPCDSTVDEPVLRYQDSFGMETGVFQLGVTVAGDVVWGLSVAAFPLTPDTL
jgi:hypothetical protein